MHDHVPQARGVLCLPLQLAPRGREARTPHTPLLRPGIDELAVLGVDGVVLGEMPRLPPRQGRIGFHEVPVVGQTAKTRNDLVEWLSTPCPGSSTMFARLKNGVSWVRARNSTLPTRCPCPGSTTTTGRVIAHLPGQLRAAERPAHQPHLDRSERDLHVGTGHPEQGVDQRGGHRVQQSAARDRRHRLRGVHVDAVDVGVRHRPDGVQHRRGDRAHRRQQRLTPLRRAGEAEAQRQADDSAQRRRYGVQRGSRSNATEVVTSSGIAGVHVAKACSTSSMAGPTRAGRRRRTEAPGRGRTRGRRRSRTCPGRRGPPRTAPGHSRRSPS